MKYNALLKVSKFWNCHLLQTLCGFLEPSLLVHLKYWRRRIGRPKNRYFNPLSWIAKDWFYQYTISTVITLRAPHLFFVSCSISFLPKDWQDCAFQSGKWLDETATAAVLNDDARAICPNQIWHTFNDDSHQCQIVFLHKKREQNILEHKIIC